MSSILMLKSPEYHSKCSTFFFSGVSLQFGVGSSCSSSISLTML